MNVCCMLSFIYCRLIINILQLLILSIEALTFPVKLVLGLAKKVVKIDKFFCIISEVTWLVGIANVLGSVGAL